MIDKPTNLDFNLMRGGQFSFYILSNDIIKVERFNHDTRMFEFCYGRIQDNGDILFYNSQGRPWGTYTQKLNLYFRKTPAKLTSPIVFPE
jgi:hypothetical protein